MYSAGCANAVLYWLYASLDCQSPALRRESDPQVKVCRFPDQTNQP